TGGALKLFIACAGSVPSRSLKAELVAMWSGTSTVACCGVAMIGSGCSIANSSGALSEKRSALTGSGTNGSWPMRSSNFLTIAGLKWLYDDTVSTDAAGFFRFVRLHLPDREQHRCLQCSHGAAHFFADFQAAVARHVDIQNDDVRFLLRDFFHRGSAVAHRYDFISGVGEDFAPHILGGHTVIGK